MYTYYILRFLYSLLSQNNFKLYFITLLLTVYSEQSFN